MDSGRSVRISPIHLKQKRDPLPSVGMTKAGKNKQRSQFAQTATELAVFGGILIFVFGLMVRQAYMANMAQNQALRGMRMALAASYDTSLKGLPARNSASFLIVEDRLSPSAERFGSTTRVPFVMAGSGTHSRQMFMPMDYGMVDELPRIDLIVNGQHFQLTIAGFGTMNLTSNNIDWDPECAFRYEYNGASNAYDILTWRGCQKFYKVAANMYDPPTASTFKNKFCCAGPTGCSGTCTQNRCCDNSNLTADERFDLNRDPLNNTPGFEPVPAVPVTEREKFAWQWYLVKAFVPARSRPSGGGICAQDIVSYEVNFGETMGDSENLIVDVDRDLMEESIMLNSLELYTNSDGVLTKIDYLDSQLGDMDLSFDAKSRGPQPGLQPDIKVYSFTRDGTYLAIDDGKLYDINQDGRQFIRNVQKKDHIELIERRIQLSHNTNRFCDTSNARIPTVDPTTQLAHPNPIDVCANPPSTSCFDQVNLDKTCFDPVTKMIYVRSRIYDLGGKKWVTPVAP